MFVASASQHASQQALELFCTRARYDGAWRVWWPVVVVVVRDGGGGGGARGAAAFLSGGLEGGLSNNSEL